ncbi:hypothetical protein [Pseudochryseolinea flava]|uniref:Uncharacterized protein n=1 Tax=Pseudochryseolinea flava TaxID=2059302 RepID=A0A364Y346_9BACT|nr:hypothetical protein [Pseudochryseolinea flava]RAW00566.1 hypothetical protein DQQ10_13280 [Pseudochryseolinea flava]
MISDGQREVIRQFLERKGMTFKPLQAEMIDHISCDVEDRMATGISFEDALESALLDLPEDHFEDIQQETLEVIDKRASMSKWITYAVLLMLPLSVVFKIFHLQFATEILLLSFVLLGLSLLQSSLHGMYLHRKKRGVFRVLLFVLSAVILIAGYGFKISHLAGAEILILGSIVMVLVSIVVNTFHAHRANRARENLMTFLHEKYSPGIDRFLLLLLIPIAIGKVLQALGYVQHGIVDPLALIVIFGGGIQLIALSWRAVEKQILLPIYQVVIAQIFSAACLAMVFLGEIVRMDVRIALIVFYTIVSAWLALKVDQTNSIIPTAFACFVSLIFSVWGLCRLDFVSGHAKTIIFNIPIAVMLLIGILLCRKYEATRTYLIVSAAGYMIEYFK